MKNGSQNSGFHIKTTIKSAWNVRHSITNHIYIIEKKKNDLDERMSDKQQQQQI